VLVEDTNGKSRGYAFIEFEHERDMRQAYKYAEGQKIDGRRVLVDVERGRTVTDWRPRRLGGGMSALDSIGRDCPWRMRVCDVSSALWPGGRR
jgi:U1 small nuclear ribonucleoprotein